MQRECISPPLSRRGERCADAGRRFLQGGSPPPSRRRCDNKPQDRRHGHLYEGVLDLALSSRMIGPPRTVPWLADNPLISVVDDDEAVRESLRGLLRSVRFGVDVFASGEEFLSSHRTGGTDCLLLDVRMPGMSGLDLQRSLMATHPEIPIIFITSHGDEELRSRALRGGAVDYLLKPFSEEALLKAVQRALGPRMAPIAG